MLKFTIPDEKGKRTAQGGTKGRAIDVQIKQIQPEAAYFTRDQGNRGRMIFFEVLDPARLTEFNEPSFGL